MPRFTRSLWAVPAAALTLAAAQGRAAECPHPILPRPGTRFTASRKLTSAQTLTLLRAHIKYVFVL